jgi:hypothetical protein
MLGTNNFSVARISTGASLSITNTAFELVPEDKENTELIEQIFRRVAALWAEVAARAREKDFQSQLQ